METSKQSSLKVMAVLAVLIALFLIVATPFIVQTSLGRVLENLVDVVKERPQFTSGFAIFNLFYPIWQALAFVAGIVLLVITPSILKGEKWVSPVLLILYAIPSIGGMFMFLPYVSWVGGFPLPMVISWVGLIGYWVTIWLQDADRFQKTVDFLVLTFLGMLATHAFVIGVGSQRQLMVRAGKPLYQGLQYYILTLVGEVNWIAVILMFAAILLIAMRKKAGWYLALISAFSILAINIPTQFIRTKTLDYLYGSILAIFLVIFLLIPSFKARLFTEIKK
ncbi:MAG TPA: hypothetical protein G4N95_05715 [Anaerolineae bacterium]|nr:hypothetical protein [Anaerolineae bacterium]